MKMKLKTKDIVIAALLTSMSILIPNIFPSIPLGPFTATFASHLPVVVSMFVSPTVALITSIGSVLGFTVKFISMPWVIARAAMHIPFAILGAYMIKKNRNVAFTIFLTMLAHSVLEVVAVLPFLNIMPQTPKTLEIAGMAVSLTWVMVILIGTMIHHLIDFAIAMLVVPFLRKSGYLKKEKVGVK